MFPCCPPGIAGSQVRTSDGAVIVVDDGAAGGGGGSGRSNVIDVEFREVDSSTSKK